ncbi:MAG: phosphoglycolate phosphatase, partial [Thiohalobacterales bacterium]|nr:phosphoglycolate phosphatase [Thiohalobacterales bacterium]
MTGPHGRPAGLAIRTVLFDLDGTLLDTAPDLADALNRVLEDNGRPPLPFDLIRPVVSHGGIALIDIGFGLAHTDPQFELLRAQLLKVYRANISRKTRPFPGMAEVLDTLEARGINWGVVTNKPGWLTDPLLHDLGLHTRAACVVSGDTLDERKPHPAPMLHACEQAGSSPAECVYIGDAQRDIEAGINAGMHTVVALFGYIPADDDPRAWQADAEINTPGELLNWLDSR